MSVRHLIVAAASSALMVALATGARAATVWVRPSNTNATDSTTYSGADSTTANARSLAWFNARGKPGDICKMVPGTYTVPIRPVNSGTAGSYITFEGDIGTPANIEVPSIQLDSTNSSARGWQRISIKGVTSIGDITLKNRYSQSGYDSLRYVVGKSGLYLSGVGGSVIRNCTLGTGDVTDKMALSRGSLQPGDTLSGDPHGLKELFHVWASGLSFTDNTLNMATRSGANATECAWIKSGTFARNRITVRKLDSTTGDTHLNTWYDCQDMDIADNHWMGTADGLNDETYILNVRDNTIANRWVRDTLTELPGSVRKIKAAFMTSGAYPGTSHNNLWDSNLIRVRGFIGYQHAPKGDIHRFNVYVNEGGMALANCSSPSCTEPNDSLTFTHNTVSAIGSTSGTYTLANHKITNSRVTQNIFASRNPNNYGHVGYNGWAPGVVDSNLVWCSDPRDSIHAVQVPTGSSRLRLDVWSTAYGNDVASHWGSPEFSDTTSLYTYDVTPSATGLGVSSNLWADGFVGAINNGTPADVTAPIVTLSYPIGPGRSWLANDYMFIQWSATDNVAVEYVNLYYARNVAPDVWRPIFVGSASASGEYTWRLPNLRASSFAIILEAFDAAGNSSHASVLNYFSCLTCDPDEPLMETP